MKVYQARVEVKLCAHSPACAHHVVKKGGCPHPKTVHMATEGPISDSRTGPQQRASGHVNRGTFAMVYTAEIPEWVPMLSDDEQAALRIGGTKAMRSILAAKDRAERRARKLAEDLEQIRKEDADDAEADVLV